MAVSKENYKNFSADELIQDDFFIASMIRPNYASERFWKEFLLSYPEQADSFNEASSLIKNLRFKKDTPAPGARERVWNNLLKQPKETGKLVRMHKPKRWIWAAASIVFIALSVATWFLVQSSETTKIQTAYGEVRKLVLPDQSIVTLNAHSSIEYKNSWEGDKVREVWLTGEAFFDVKHLNKYGEPVKASDRFIVHAGKMNVEVLGTSFNVSERQSVTKVALQTGKVRIDFKDKTLESVVMKPGELVQYNTNTKKVVKEDVANTEKYTSWKEKELLLNNTSMQDVISTIENTFGYKVEVEDKELLSRQLSGTEKISLKDEQTLLTALELILNVEITKNDKTLTIRNK